MARGADSVAMPGFARTADGYARQPDDPQGSWNEAGSGERPSSRSGRANPDTRPARRFTLTGLGAVAFVFVITLGVATLESLLGIGLRTLTLIALSLATLVAGLWVRRSDLATVVVAPPLVFGLVAALEIALAPTLNFTVTVLASILVRGFPTMTIATAIALLVCGYRLLRRR